MERIVVTENDSGFECALGTKVAIWCGVYIYTGVLSGVNEDHIELSDPMIVYETGDLLTGPWADAQKLPSPWRVMKQGIESWGAAKC